MLLLLLTLLAVSGMRSAALELAMAGNAQARQHAFEAAESAIEVALSQHTFSRSAAVPLRISLGAAEAEAAITYIESTGVPDATFSLGVGTLGSIQAFHFEVVAVGSGPRGATSTHRQGFYLIGPGER